MQYRLRALALLTALLSASVAACSGGANEPSLSLTWQLQSAEARLVEPSEIVQTVVVVHNDGSADLDNVVLRFDQLEGGKLPAGLTIGTVTNTESRFEGNVQVWNLGRIEAGETLEFPIALWFDAASATAEPLPLRLYVTARSPNLEALVLSTPLEIEVDSRLASR